jgi:SAM-dependent methyltransferase
VTNASATAESHTTGLVADLRTQAAAWRTRPLVRRLYHDWYRLVVERLSPAPGPTIELGSGISRFKEHFAAAVATDVEPTPWTGEVVDAERLPYEQGSIANLVLVDVFHHLASPRRFLDEARRVLVQGGRAVLLEPYCSPVSYRAYRRLHQERTEMDVAPFVDDPAVAESPMLANVGRPTLVLFRHLEELQRRWPELAVLERRRLALLVYPLSGGFTRPELLPCALVRPAAALERLLTPLAPLRAFRCLVVLERR